MGENRKDKSLYTLAKKFVEILKTEETVDLNNVANELNFAKKRRIYDVSNVLEGIGLIKKRQKNFYEYTGKTYKDSEKSDQTKLKNLRDEKQGLIDQEKELDNDISNMKMMLQAHANSSTYLYLTRNDFIKAFGMDSSSLILQDCRSLKFLFKDLTNAPPQILITGTILKPVSVKLVNNINQNSLPEIDLEDNELISQNTCSSYSCSDDSTHERSKKRKKPSEKILLFRRSIKPKSFSEIDLKESEELSTNVLSHNRFEGKSKFYYITQKKLVLASDYEQPHFISMEPPIDEDYGENYSTFSPSVHDLYDIDVEPKTDKVDDTSQNAEDVEMIEEYIVEELDEDAYEMLQ